MDLKFVEIIGPPGVGKSTVYKALVRSWTPASNWAVPDISKYRKESILSIRTWKKFIKKFVSGNAGSRNFTEEGLRFAKQHPDLANYIWSLLSDERIFGREEIEKRFRASKLVLNCFEKYQRLIESKKELPVVLEEGFLQRSFLVHRDQELVASILEEYLRLAPLPTALVFLNATDTGLILNRLDNRSKKVYMHAGKGSDEVAADVECWKQTFGIMTEKLKARGVKVFELDAQQPVEENARKIIEIARSLNQS